MIKNRMVLTHGIKKAFLRAANYCTLIAKSTNKKRSG